MEGLNALQRKYADRILDVRGKGLMIGVEFVESLESREPAGELRERIVDEAFRRGLIIIGCGASTVRFSPPLVIDRDDVETALRIFDESIAAAMQ